MYPLYGDPFYSDPFYGFFHQTVFRFPVPLIFYRT